MKNMALPFGITRDSWIWWLTLAGAALAYLGADGRPPTAWGYSDWLKAGIAATGWLIGKLQTSPLIGDNS